MDPSGAITVVDSSGTIYGASYSPDGTELAYAIANGAGSDVHIASGDSANGLHDDVLVGDPSTWNVEPTWAPDGQTIAFLRGPADGSDCVAPCSPVDDRDLTLWAIDRDGSNLRSISEAAHGRTGFSMSWSPDGTQLAVTVWSGAGTPQIFVVSVRNGQVARLASSAQGPAWSPNGGAVAFVTPVGDGTWTVHLVDSDGENERPLLTPPVDPSSSVLWSRFPAG
jgi:Tol biopolymer transport system component